MSRTRKTQPPSPVDSEIPGYDAILTGMVELLEAARRSAARAVNAVMTATYWDVGRRIVEHEQRGSERAEYGARLMERLAADLTKRFGRGFSRQNLQQMRQFYQTYPPDAIRQTASGELNIPATPQVGTASADGPLAIIQQLARRFPLPWVALRRTPQDG